MTAVSTQAETQDTPNTPESSASGAVDTVELERRVQEIRDDFPGVTIRINPTAEQLLRESTRSYAPEIADALDGGDVRGAAALFAARLEKDHPELAGASA